MDFRRPRDLNPLPTDRNENGENEYLFQIVNPPLLLLLLFLAHQHKACRQLKIKQEMTVVGD